MGSSVLDEQYTDSHAWRDHGSFKVSEQQTFGYDREAADPFHLQINGKEYELRQGRVLVMHEDGTVEQLKLFPVLATASNPDELAKLIEAARAMNEEPTTAEKSRQQLEATEAQLHDVLKTCAPTHPFVIAVRRSADALKQKIRNQTARPSGAAASTAFGPVIERVVIDFLDLDSGKLLQPPNPPSGKPEGWMEQGATPEWMAQQGIDVTWASDGLIGVGMTVVSLANEKWSKGGTDWLLDLLSSAKPPEPLVKIVRTDNLPETWGFKTREGGVGVLQIVGTTRERGLIIPEIRYKLLQRTPTPVALEPLLEGTDIKVSIPAALEAFVKSMPVTDDQRAALFVHDATSASSFRMRPGIVRYPIFRDVKPPSPDAIPVGEILNLPDGSYYYQLDEFGASTLHYYGPFYPDVAAEFGLTRSPVKTEQQ